MMSGGKCRRARPDVVRRRACGRRARGRRPSLPTFRESRCARGRGPRVHASAGARRGRSTDPLGSARLIMSNSGSPARRAQDERDPAARGARLDLPARPRGSRRRGCDVGWARKASSGFPGHSTSPLPGPPVSPARERRDARTPCLAIVFRRTPSDCRSAVDDDVVSRGISASISTRGGRARCERPRDLPEATSSSRTSSSVTCSPRFCMSITSSARSLA